MCLGYSPFANAMSRRALLKHTVAGGASAEAAGATLGFVCRPAGAAIESIDTL